MCKLLKCNDLYLGTYFLSFLFFLFLSCAKNDFNKNGTLISDEPFLENNLPATSDLNIAAREPHFLTGSEIVKEITDLDLEDREDVIFREVTKGNIPDFLRKASKVSDRIFLNEAHQYITYYVLPDYLAVGSNDDYFICPLTPKMAQKIANKLDCFIPTKRMVDQIWDASALKMVPEPIPPSDQMTTVAVFSEHNSLVWKQRQSNLETFPLGTLVSGHKKDVVISKLIYTSPSPDRVVIYGWHDKTGKNIQPLYAGHHANYVDYSHGIRLVQNKVYVNDEVREATEVLESNSLRSFLSDEGVLMKPYYPE